MKKSEDKSVIALNFVKHNMKRKEKHSIFLFHVLDSMPPCGALLHHGGRARRVARRIRQGHIRRPSEVSAPTSALHPQPPALGPTARQYTERGRICQG